MLEAGATVHAPSFVGAGAILRAGATVGPLASIGHGAIVGAGSSVERAVLQAGARVGEGCELRDVVIGPDYELPDGAAPLCRLAARSPIGGWQAASSLPEGTTSEIWHSPTRVCAASSGRIAQMPVLAAIRERFARTQPLRGRRISACLHVTAETANLMRTLRAGGADVVLCASNPLSTQDDVAAALTARYEVPTFAIRGEGDDAYYAHIYAAVDHRPQITMDDGADVIGVLHTHRREQLGDVIGATEETTTGVIRLRAMERDGVLGFPVIAVNEAARSTSSTTATARGSRRSTASCARRTSCSPGASSSSPATAGAGRASPSRARGMGARVVVCEVDPLRALEAVMEGFEVLPMERAAAIGDVFCTATGDRDVIRREHFEQMKDGALLANTGHFNVEIDIARPAGRREPVRCRRAPASRGSCCRTAAACTCSPRGGSSTSPPPRAIPLRSWT